MDEPTKALIEAALALADSLSWDITDSGHAVVRCDYDLSEQLADAATAYREAAGEEQTDESKHQQAVRGLAAFVRR